MLISVVGAAGAIGRSTVEAALRGGHRVRALGRDASRLKAIWKSSVDCVAADVSTPEGCHRAVEGADAVVYAVGLPYRTKAFAAYPRMSHDILRAAYGSTPTAFVHISNVYPYGLPRGRVVDETHPLSPVGPKGKYRLEQEQVVLGAHTRQLATAVLRLPTFFGVHAQHALMATAARSIAAGRPAPLLAPVDVPLEHVVVSDVGPVIVDLLSTSGFGGEAYNMAGTALATQQELAERLIDAAGIDVPFRIMPAGLRRALSYVVPMLREMREVDYLLTRSFALSEQKLEAQLGHPIRHTDLSTAAMEWIASLRPEGLAISSPA